MHRWGGRRAWQGRREDGGKNRWIRRDEHEPRMSRGGREGYEREDMAHRHRRGGGNDANAWTEEEQHGRTKEEPRQMGRHHRVARTSVFLPKAGRRQGSGRSACSLQMFRHHEAGRSSFGSSCSLQMLRHLEARSSSWSSPRSLEMFWHQWTRRASYGASRSQPGMFRHRGTERESERGRYGGGYGVDVWGEWDPANGEGNGLPRNTRLPRKGVLPRKSRLPRKLILPRKRAEIASRKRKGRQGRGIRRRWSGGRRKLDRAGCERHCSPEWPA